MDAKVNRLSLTGDKFMLEMYLRQPAFAYSACGPFTKKKKPEIQDIFVKEN